MCSYQWAEFFLYLKTLENYCAPKHKLWKIFLCLGKEERHSEMKVIISLGIHYNGAVPFSHFFPFCFGVFPYYGPLQYYQNHPSGRYPAAYSTFSHNPQSWPLAAWDNQAPPRPPENRRRIVPLTRDRG